MDKTHYWYMVTIQKTIDDNGKNKKIKEQYLIKGVSIGDAELQISNWLDGTLDDYRVVNIVESKIVGVLSAD